MRTFESIARIVIRGDAPHVDGAPGAAARLVARAGAGSRRAPPSATSPRGRPPGPWLSALLGLAWLAGCQRIPTGGSDEGEGGSWLTTGTGAATSASDVGSTSAGSTSATASTSTSDAPSSTSGSTAGPGDSGSTTSGCNFICERDGGGADVQCDVWAQDCPDGQKCAPWANDGGSSWNATKCVDVTGTDNPGDQCMVIGSGVSGEDSCVEGSMCWNSDENGVGTCVGFCQGSPDAPSCTAYPGTNVSANNFLCLCLSGCDPLLQDCEAGDVCISTGADGFWCVLDASGDTGAVGDPCEYANGCDPGNACVRAEVFPGCADSLGCCTNFCDLRAGNSGCTEAGTECLPWYELGTAPSHYVDVGVCVLSH